MAQSGASVSLRKKVEHSSSARKLKTHRYFRPHKQRIHDKKYDKVMIFNLRRSGCQRRVENLNNRECVCTLASSRLGDNVAVGFSGNALKRQSFT